MDFLDAVQACWLGFWWTSNHWPSDLAIGHLALGLVRAYGGLQAWAHTGIPEKYEESTNCWRQGSNPWPPALECFNAYMATAGACCCLFINNTNNTLYKKTNQMPEQNKKKRARFWITQWTDDTNSSMSSKTCKNYLRIFIRNKGRNFLLKSPSGHINTFQEHGWICHDLLIKTMFFLWANCTWNRKPQKNSKTPTYGDSWYRAYKCNSLIPKACKGSCDHKYAISLFNRCQNNVNRNQEQSCITKDLHCTRGSGNALSGSS